MTELPNESVLPELIWIAVLEFAQPPLQNRQPLMTKQGQHLRLPTKQRERLRPQDQKDLTTHMTRPSLRRSLQKTYSGNT